MGLGGSVRNWFAKTGIWAFRHRGQPRAGRGRTRPFRVGLCPCVCPTNLLSWGLCPYEIKITSSTSGTMSAAQVGRRVKKSHGPPESYFLVCVSVCVCQKLAFAESALSGLDLCIVD